MLQSRSRELVFRATLQVLKSSGGASQSLGEVIESADRGDPVSPDLVRGWPPSRSGAGQRGESDGAKRDRRRWRRGRSRAVDIRQPALVSRSTQPACRVVIRRVPIRATQSGCVPARRPGRSARTSWPGQQPAPCLGADRPGDAIFCAGAGTPLGLRTGAPHASRGPSAATDG
jgi:hypothetical protein